MPKKTTLMVEGVALTQISHATGIPIPTLINRYNKNPQITLHEMMRPRHRGRPCRTYVDDITVAELAKQKGISKERARYWYVEKGWPLDAPNPPKQGRVYIEGLTIREIAEVFHMSVSAVNHQYYRRGKRTVREIVKAAVDKDAMEDIIKKLIGEGRMVVDNEVV